jgi:hypothetical protein
VDAPPPPPPPPPTVAPGVYHKYVVGGETDAVLRCVIEPGDADFERLLMVLNGLAEDGELEAMGDSVLLMAVISALSSPPCLPPFPLPYVLISTCMLSPPGAPQAEYTDMRLIAVDLGDAHLLGPAKAMLDGVYASQKQEVADLKARLLSKYDNEESLRKLLAKD